jgi:hypothetical protein
MTNDWDALGTKEKMDFLRREVEGIKQVLAVLARQINEISAVVKSGNLERSRNDE